MSTADYCSGIAWEWFAAKIGECPLDVVGQPPAKVACFSAASHPAESGWQDAKPSHLQIWKTISIKIYSTFHNILASLYHSETYTFFMHTCMGQYGREVITVTAHSHRRVELLHFVKGTCNESDRHSLNDKVQVKGTQDEDKV